MRTIRLIILIFPWVALIALYLYYNEDETEELQQTQLSTAVLQEMEALGKLELVKYNFKEITELQEMSEKFLRIFQLGPDSKIALISQGEAVGCMDLTTITPGSITFDGDTLYLELPEPELCYYKLDMSKTKIYSLETNPLKDERAFIQRAYKAAEQDVKNAAIKSGILQHTRENGEQLLKPLLENITGKTVLFKKGPEGQKIIPD